MTQQQDNDPLFNEENLSKNAFISWGKFGDFVKGTLTSKKQVPNKLSETPGAMQWNYEILADTGSFHAIKDDIVSPTPTIIQPGNFIKVGGRVSIDDHMRNIKVGQIVGLRYNADGKKVKGRKVAKIVGVYPGAINKDYMGQTASDQLQDAFPGAEEIGSPV